MRPAQRLSTVVTPAGSYNLIDLPTLKTLLGVVVSTSDSYFNLVIAQASAAAQNFCNNRFVVETLQDQIFPARDGIPFEVRGGLDALKLFRWPIVSVSSVVETIAGVATSLVQGTDFLADLSTGELIRLDSDGDGRPERWKMNPVVATYSAGYAAIPGDVVDAVAEMVKSRWYAQSRDPMLRSQNAVGIYEASYWFASGPGADTDMPPNIQAKLERYRIPLIA